MDAEASLGGGAGRRRSAGADRRLLHVPADDVSARSGPGQHHRQCRNGARHDARADPDGGEACRGLSRQAARCRDGLFACLCRQRPGDGNVQNEEVDEKLRVRASARAEACRNCGCSGLVPIEQRGQQRTRPYDHARRRRSQAADGDRDQARRRDVEAIHRRRATHYRRSPASRDRHQAAARSGCEPWRDDQRALQRDPDRDAG